ncbi:MAG: Bug family tripartite tricarboxylate transporter substrate binding protein [Betaproteobacteria bacterium]
MRALIALSFLLSFNVFAQYPSKPLTWIVPFPPGGPTDSFSRTERLAKSAPDGYTVALASTGSHAINPHLYGPRLQYDALKDFTPLTKANPGKFTFGSAGNGSSNHLSGEVLKYVTGAPMQHVPYKGSAPALTDVIAGNITGMFDVLVTSLTQHRTGKVPKEFADVIRRDHERWGRIVKGSGAKVD